MGRFEQRVTQLEKRMGTKHAPRLIYLTPNLEGDKAKETSYAVKISSEVWAHVLGNSGPFTDEEIDRLREEYAEEWKRQQ